jgi:cyclopropane-fatty-acyl-phospholipid synthase
MIDKNLQYTCGYWKTAKDLDAAQIDKMNLIALKLKLEPGMKVLDFGCGYGTLGVYLAKNFGVSVVGVSISEEQNKYAKKISKGLSCDFRLCDYRDINEKFDRIVSIGLLEHVGVHNYKTFFEVCHQCLKDDGIFLLHTIGTLHKMLQGGDLFTHK